MNKNISKQALIAAIYFVLTTAFFSVSYGLIQFRVAEMLIMLAFYDKKNIYGLTVGCMLANLFSPMMILDLVFGTLASFIVLTIISRMNNKLFIPLIAGVINGVIIGLMLYFVGAETSLIVGFSSVFISEILVVSIGVAVFSILEKNSWFEKNVISSKK